MPWPNSRNISLNGTWRAAFSIMRVTVSASPISSGGRSWPKGTDHESHIHKQSSAVLEIDRMRMRLALTLGRIRPVLALEGERVVGPRGLDDRHALLEELAVARVFVALAVPRAGRLRARHGRVVLEPARLVAAHERDVEPATEQMIQSRRVLGHAERVVRGQHVAELIDPEPRAVPAEEHRHEARVLTELESLDLQVVFG